MNVVELLAQLQQRGIKLWVSDGELRYRAPRGALTQELRANLAAHKAQVLAFLHQADHVKHTTLPPIKPCKRNGPAPLSFAQERLWFLDQWQPGTAAYNLFESVRMEGRLDTHALERSFNTIIQRHEALRTIFDVRDGQPVQIIVPTSTYPLRIIDIQMCFSQQYDILLRHLAFKEKQEPFNLRNGPLIRFSLIRLTPTDHVLFLSMHHIISDGWSMGVFIREAVQCYTAYIQDATPQLADLAIQYIDFAYWQRDWLSNGALDDQLTYWKDQLANAQDILQLPIDRQRPALQTFEGTTVTRLLPQALLQSLNSICQQTDTTLFMALLSLFNVLLCRYTKQNDILVGTPIANRTQIEVEQLIGFFVNTLVLRTDLSDNPTLVELLRRVRITTLAAYEHQDTPFEKVVETLQPTRDLSLPPLFQVLFVLQNTPMPQAELPDLTFTPVPFEGSTAQFDLSMFVLEQPAGLQVALQYNTNLFEETTILRMHDHFHRLVEAVITDFQQPIAHLSILTKQEMQQLLIDWNKTDGSRLENMCIHHLVTMQATRTPQSVAVLGSTSDKLFSQSPSFAELETVANRLAWYLQHLGIGPEQCVSICLQRTPTLVASLLAVLKSGGSYVPLDPAYPKDRLEFVINDTQSAVILTDTEVANLLPQTDAKIVYLDLLADQLTMFPSVPPVSTVTAQNLAYLIYTSGSTGQPKGVAITHSSAVTMLAWAQERFGKEERVGLLAATSVCFDLSVFEIFVPLAWGGTIILAENILQIASHPAYQNIRLINTVPSALAELLRQETLPEDVRVIN
ncbi:MAG: condensation domain-containing protein, partial [Chloroflexota bacterium]